MVVAWDPTPTTSAIEGLRRLLARPEWRDSAQAPAIRAALRQRLADPDEPNRLIAAQALSLIEPTDDGRLHVARERLLAETHPIVRAVLLQQLGSLLPGRAAEVDQLLAELGSSGRWPLFASNAAVAPPAGAVTGAEGADEAIAERELLQVVVHLLLALGLRYQQPLGVGVIGRWFTHPLDYPEVFEHAVFGLRNLGMLHPSGQADVAARAFALLQQATEQLVMTVEEQSSGEEQDPAPLRSAVRLADDVVDQLYFASGALDDKRAARLGEGQQPEANERPFYELSIPLLERLAQVHYPHVTHRLVETLAYLAEHDPRRVFLAVHAAVAPGHGYEYEPMAVDLVVGIIRRYLANYRDVVTSDEAGLAALREILEAFVQVGWSSAVALAYELPDVFR
jgi:hypothetical protein